MLIEKAQQIIDIIAPIPAKKFITDVFGDDRGNCCFLGHIHIAVSRNKSYYGDYYGYGARHLTAKFLREKHGLEDISGVNVNNSPNINGYDEPEIKDRVMHMLNDMVEAGY